MVLYFINFLESFKVHVPSVFSYVSTRMILAGITSLFLTIFLGPFFIRKLERLKISEKIKMERKSPLLFRLHKRKEDTPTMGGGLIIFSILISLVLWMDLQSMFTYILLFTTIFFAILGGVDDYLKLRGRKGLKVRWKFFFQVLFGAFLSFYIIFSSTQGKETFLTVKEKGAYKKMEVVEKSDYISRLYVPFFKRPLIIPSFFIVFFLFLFVVVGSSNGVNLADGLDGLAAGLTIMVASVFAIFSFFSNNIEISKYLNIPYIERSGEIGIYLFSLAGALFGFLWYNGYPAQVFMGDIGSLTMGAILGVTSILLKRELLLALAGGIFVVEAISVILQVLSCRFRGGRRIFLCSPLHHHFEYKGWAEPKVVLRFWIVGLFFAILSVASLKFQ